MGDLTSNYNCGCGRNERTSCGCNNGCGNNSCLWIILILLFCGGGNTFGRSGCGCNDGCDNSCIWIILILLFCGGGNTFGTNNGCGCGCGCNDGCC